MLPDADSVAAAVQPDAEDYSRAAMENFGAVLDGSDFAAEMDIVGLGRFQFSRRTQMRVECRGMYIALWRLALGRSFPANAHVIFSTFCDAYGRRRGDKHAPAVIQRAKDYWELLRDTDGKDFCDVAERIVSLFVTEEARIRNLVLKLALHMRTTYQMIFDRLI